MTQLTKYDQAKAALAECRSVDEAKAWRDQAQVMAYYARQAKDRDLEADAAAIRLRAERALGGLLTEQKRAGGLKVGRPKNGSDAEPFEKPVTLAEAGIDKKLSARAQKIAAVPEAQFEAEVEGLRSRIVSDGARTAAKLESIGEAQAEDEEEFDLEADAKEEALAALEEMQRVFDADDKLKAAVDEVKRLKTLERVLQSRIDEKATTAVALEKDGGRWMRKAQRYEKAAKACTCGAMKECK